MKLLDRLRLVFARGAAESRMNQLIRFQTYWVQPSMASTLAAASACSAGRTWLYVFIVRLICECPSVSMIVRGSTPCASNRVAAV